MRWGFIPHWWKEVTPPKFSTINARMEDAPHKPMWRDAWYHRRCLIAATHWHEWQKGRRHETAVGVRDEGRRSFHVRGSVFAMDVAGL